MSHTVPPAFARATRLEVYPRLRNIPSHSGGTTLRWYWRFVTGNGHTLATGRGEGFLSALGATTSAETVLSRVTERTTIAKREEDADTPWAWMNGSSDVLPAFLVVE